MAPEALLDITEVVNYITPALGPGNKKDPASAYSILNYFMPTGCVLTRTGAASGAVVSHLKLKWTTAT